MILFFSRFYLFLAKFDYFPRYFPFFPIFSLLFPLSFFSVFSTHPIHFFAGLGGGGRGGRDPPPPCACMLSVSSWGMLPLSIPQLFAFDIFLFSYIIHGYKDNAGTYSLKGLRPGRNREMGDSLALARARESCSGQFGWEYLGSEQASIRKIGATLFSRFS